MVGNGTETTDTKKTKEEKLPVDSTAVTETVNNAEEFDYEKLLSQYSLDYSKFAEGEVIKGKIIGKTETEVIIDIGYKSEGIIPIDEFLNSRGEMQAKIGDEVYVLLEEIEDSNGNLLLSKEKAVLMEAWGKIENAYEKGETVTGYVIERIKGGLSVDVGVRAFLPGSLVDVRRVRDLDSLVGKEVEMKVIKVSRSRNNIVLSRKAVLEEANAERKQKTLDQLETGKLMKGLVKNITEYGAFIDLGGIDGLLHITDMSWGRVNHPSELFALDDEVEVIVLDYDLETERVSLGYKQRHADPWENLEANYPSGKRVKGKVVSLTGYGAFVELEEGVEGLIHVSEMSWVKKVKHPSQVLNVGDTVETLVLDLDKENRRISLGLKQTEQNPWELVKENYKIGDKIQGRVRNLTEFGAFVELEEGIDGLVHISDMSWTNRVNHPSEVVKKGEMVEAVILDIDPANERISLGIKQLEPSAWDLFFDTHSLGDTVTGKIVRLTDFGAFVELAENIEGLVHVSELAEHRIDKPADEYTVGDPIEMKIIKLNREEKKIGLSVRAFSEKKTSKKKKVKAEPEETSMHFGDVLSSDPTLENYRKEIERRAKETEISKAEAEKAANISASEADAGTPELIVPEEETVEKKKTRKTAKTADSSKKEEKKPASKKPVARKKAAKTTKKAASSKNKATAEEEE